jgi:large subunit ribosomal protein L30
MDKASKTVRVRWVRSGIGFTQRQKQRVRGLGLHRLHQVVELPDTPAVRGLVASIPHLVEVVPSTPRPGWLSVPEYTITPPEPVSRAGPPEQPERSVEVTNGEAPVVSPSEAVASGGVSGSSGKDETPSEAPEPL